MFNFLKKENDKFIIIPSSIPKSRFFTVEVKLDPNFKYRMAKVYDKKTREKTLSSQCEFVDLLKEAMDISLFKGFPISTAQISINGEGDLVARVCKYVKERRKNEQAV